MSSGVLRTLRFVVALALIVYEAVLYDGPPRWVLLGVYLTMMGLPIAEWGDDLRRAATGASSKAPGNVDGVDEQP